MLPLLTLLALRLFWNHEEGIGYKSYLILSPLNCGWLRRMGEDDPRVPLLKSASSQDASVVSSIVNLFSDWWLWELAEACTSILAVLVIASILYFYDGSPLPSWPSIFTVRPRVPGEHSMPLIISHRSIPSFLSFPLLASCASCLLFLQP